MAENQDDTYKIKFDTNAKQVANETNKLGASIENVTNSTNENNEAVEQGNEAYKTFKTQLREANQELQKQIQLTGESSEETIKAAKAVAELKDQMGFAADLTESFNPDQKMKALGAATRVAATGVQGVTAGMALFGDQSEDTQKMLLKVQAAMAFSDAISGMSDLSDQWALLKNVVQDSYAKIVAAKRADIAVTTQATIAQRLLNLVAQSNPYVLVASALAAVAIGTYAWIKATKEAEKQIEKATTSIGKNKVETDNLKKSIDLSTKSASESNSIEILRAKAFGATDAEIQKLIKSQKELAVTTTGTQAKEAYTNLLKANKNVLDAIKTGEEELIDSAKQTQSDAQTLYTQANDAYNNAIISDVENTLNARIATNEKIKENAATAANDAEEKKRKEKEANEKAIDEEKKKKEQDLKEADDFFKTANEKEKENNEIQLQTQKDQLTALEDGLKEFRNFEEEDAAKAAELDRLKLESKKALDEGLKSLGNQGVAAAKDLFAKNKTIQKGIVAVEGAVALGKVAVNTVNQVSADNTASPLTLGMPWSGIHIGMGALGAASIISNTNKQLQALGGGGSVSGGGSSGMTAQASAPPAVAFNNTAENQIGQSVGRTQAQQPALRVYVAESDISEAQGNVQALVVRNTI